MLTYWQAQEIAQAERILARENPDYPVSMVVVICEINNSWSVDCKDKNGQTVIKYCEGPS
jgi:hypothetical protein